MKARESLSRRRSGGRGRPPDSRRGRRRYEALMNNEELIRCFENDAVPEGSFHHSDHVRLAFAYLCEYPVLNALEKFASALKRFAATRGKTQLYNETITCAYFFLIRERIACGGGADWDEVSRPYSCLSPRKSEILGRFVHAS